VKKKKLKKLIESVLNDGIDIGVDLGHYNAHTEVVAAVEAGTLQYWIDLHTPKTLEEWDAWEAEHGKLE
jgi:hypothetical protein